uniref:VWFA domain-containing protein n=1 Tax=Plectus sambesii TaxID=2011161 RepID=A0A914XC92_9BILA
MAKRSRANIFLIASLFIVTVLLIIAVTFLVITLGKNSDTTTCATPPAQPCDQKTVLPYYFSVESSSISYEDVKNDYIGSARKLQDQITQALNSAQSSERSADRSALDANSNLLPVAVLGISNGTGGVLVIASAVFTGSSLPNSQSITTALNSNGLETIMIANGTEPINSSINTQLCQQVNPVPPGASTANTPPTSPPKTTPSPVTISNQPTKQPPPPPTTTCPICYCPTPTIMRTTTTSSTPCPPPTATPAFPCQTNVIFLIDASNGVTDGQFKNQTSFIASIFQTDWTYKEISIAIGEYSDPLGFDLFAAFGDVTSYTFAQNVFKQDVSHSGANASLTA